MSGAVAAADAAATADDKAPSSSSDTAPPTSLTTLAFNVLQAFLLCTVFMLVGPALILLNKYIMQKLPFPYPMFLSGLGVFTSYLFSKALIVAGFATVEKKAEVEGARFYTRVRPLSLEVALFGLSRSHLSSPDRHHDVLVSLSLLSLIPLNACLAHTSP